MHSQFIAVDPLRGGTLMKHFVENFEEYLSSLALALVLLVVFANVIARYIFNHSLIGSDEIASAGFVWCIFIGSSACYKRKMHIGIDVLVNLFPSSTKLITEFLTAIFMLAVNLFLTYLSLQFSLSATKKLTAVLRLSYFWVDISVTIAFALMSFYASRNLIGSFKALYHRSKS
jgi:TRAP-type C4-dicarboxylate transport system permease small subunit